MVWSSSTVIAPWARFFQVRTSLRGVFPIGHVCIYVRHNWPLCGISQHVMSASVHDADVGVGVVHSTSSTFAEPLSRSLERPLLGTAAVSLCRRLGGSALVDEAPRLSAVSCAQISHHCAHMSAMKNVEPSAFCVDVPSRHAYVVHYAQ